MLRKLSLSVLTLAVGASLVVSGCGKKSEDMTPVQPGETVTYKDANGLKFSFKAPKSWVAASIPGTKTAYYSTAGAQTRFTNFTDGDFGAKIEVGARQGATKEQALEEFKNGVEGLTWSAPEQTTLGGQPAIKQAYSQGADEDAYTGYRIFTDKDSIMTYFDAATFGEKRMAKYKPVFDLAEKSVTPGYVINYSSGKLDSTALAHMTEDMKPSENMSTYQGTGFTISYPDNFNVRGSARGVMIKGERQDATVQVDVLPANGNSDLAKIADENSKTAYRGAAVQNANVGGQAAKMINYSMVSSVGSRAYFLLKGDNVYRITINWPIELEAAYKPSLEKSATSFKLK